MRKKEGSITEMKKILWKPINEDHANLAVVETWYMEKCGITDCSELSGASILRAGMKELADILRKRASAQRSANSKKGGEDVRDED
jgi:hypothetical protein